MVRYRVQVTVAEQTARDSHAACLNKKKRGLYFLPFLSGSSEHTRGVGKAEQDVEEINGVRERLVIQQSPCCGVADAGRALQVVKQNPAHVFERDADQLRRSDNGNNLLYLHLCKIERLRLHAVQLTQQARQGVIEDGRRAAGLARELGQKILRFLQSGDIEALNAEVLEDLFCKAAIREPRQVSKICAVRKSTERIDVCPISGVIVDVVVALDRTKFKEREVNFEAI